MSRRVNARLRAAAVVVTVLTGALTLIAGAFGLLNLDTAAALGTPVVEPTYTSSIITGLVGLLIASRHPTHLVAWTFLAIGLSGAMLSAFRNYGFYGTVTDPGILPGAAILSWLALWGFVFPASGFFFALLVFPNGNLLGRRWWIVVALIVAGMGLFGTASALGRDPEAWTPFRSRISVEQLKDLVLAGEVVLSFGVFGAGASLVVRYRRARGDERLQLKWVAYAGCGAVILTLVAVFLFAQPEPARSLFRPFALSPLLIPIAATIAILRYRLYDIDVLIHRTLVYSVVSVVLGGAYAAAVVFFQWVLRPLTAGSEISVAISTLVVVGLFQPVRERAQRLIDRRFYRSRYDASRALDLFAARLRNEVDIEAVRGDLISVVDETLSPAHVRLWLRHTVP